MKKVITYGSFDLFHEGHRRIIERAKALGDYLIVGVTTEHYDETRGKINIRDPLMKRIENIQKTGLVDEIIIESSSGQKLEDVQKYEIDIFTVGSDWIGHFDYLREYCEVIYLERTKGISSTKLREDETAILSIGIMGTEEVVHHFIPESKYVSGVSCESIYSPDLSLAEEIGNKFELKTSTDSLEAFFSSVAGVYVASPANQHYEDCKKALKQGKHVLCEKPFVLKKEQAEELLALASEKNLVLMEAVKTAYCQGFHQLISLAKSGRIGKILSVDATFSHVVSHKKCQQLGGSFLSYGSYALLPIIKLLGTDFKQVNFTCFQEKDLDLYTKCDIYYESALSTANISLGTKRENQLVITGTKGYLLAESPWWETNSFQLCFDNPQENEKFFYKFAGDGQRYEISEFTSQILKLEKSNYKLRRSESVAMAEIFEQFQTGEKTVFSWEGK